MNTLGTLVMKFFRNYLVNERGVSPNTIASYGKCIELLLDYARERLGVSPDRLSFDAIDDQIILDFLDHIEGERGNDPATRNQRLAAIKTFFRLLARHEPTMLAACERVCAIRTKTVPHKVMATLDHHEVQAIFGQIGSATIHDARDLALLRLLYNTGARVQELVDLDVGDVRMDIPRQVRLTGKGRKERFVPLQDETVEDLRRYLRTREAEGRGGEALFLNDRGGRLTRFGIRHIVRTRVFDAVGVAPSLADRSVSPHTFRHTTALHLIQSGASLPLVKEWLGHADIKTTSLYVEINIEMKRDALTRFPSPARTNSGSGERPKWKTPEVMGFLRELSRAPALC